MSSFEMTTALFEANGERTSMFPDEEKMKQTVRDSLTKPQYNVADFYWETGIFRWIATHTIFEYTTLGVISFNALWIAIDTDNNTAATLIEATPLFIIAENLFCIYFSFEWFCRFMAFKNKRNGLRDAWFAFDSVLVFLMVMETWVLSFYLLFIASGGGNPLGNASILRLLRLLRLSRLTKLLKSMPELLILVKGMASAMKSVFYTMLLLVALLYVFAVAFTQLTVGTPLGDMYFKSIPKSMISLLLHGTFLDNLGPVVHDIAGDDSSECTVETETDGVVEEKICSDGGTLVHAVMFFIFVALAALMVMNMLIGVLCEVVSNVASIEKEEIMVTFVHDKLQTVMNEIDADGDGNISKTEFSKILSNPEAIHALVEVGVDPVGLVDFAEFIFTDNSDGHEGEEKELCFADFMDVILQLRGCNTATVKDVIDLTKTMRFELKRLENKLGKNIGRRLGNMASSPTSPMSPPDRKAITNGMVESVEEIQHRGSPPPDNQFVAPGMIGNNAAPLPPVKKSKYPSNGGNRRGGNDEPSDEQEIQVFLNAGLREIRKLRNVGLPGLCSDKSDKLLAWAAKMDTDLAEGLENLRRIQESEASFQ